MADTVPDDQLAEAFTRFRAEAREQVQPPGAHAVRHEVRRRRSVRAAGTAAAVTLLGAAVAIGTTMASPDQTPSTLPTMSTTQMQELAADAYDVLTKDVSAFGYATAVTAQTQAETHPIAHSGSSPLRWVQGQPYDLVALCRGRGTVTVTWQAPGGVTGSAPVTCGGDVVRVRFTPRADGPVIEISLTPDARAINRAGIAVAIIEFS